MGITLCFLSLLKATGPTGEGGTHIQLTIQDVMPRIREVRYDRGQIVDSEREAQRMSDANERWASFTTPTPAFILWDVLEVLQLCFLGFYVPSSARDASRVKCSFCKSNFLYGKRYASDEAANDVSEIEERVLSLKRRHAQLPDRALLRCGQQASESRTGGAQTRAGAARRSPQPERHRMQRAGTEVPIQIDSHLRHHSFGAHGW